MKEPDPNNDIISPHLWFADKLALKDLASAENIEMKNIKHSFGFVSVNSKNSFLIFQ